VAGIQAFEQGSTRAEADALTQTAVKIASDIQAKTEEPEQFGGYDGNLDSGTPNATGSITLQEMAYEPSSGVYSTADGDCAIRGGGNDALTVTDSGISDDGTVNVLCESKDVEVIAKVNGLTSGDIETVQAIDSGTDLSS
jgi:hypothetical protein